MRSVGLLCEETSIITGAKVGLRGQEWFKKLQVDMASLGIDQTLQLTSLIDFLLGVWNMGFICL